MAASIQVAELFGKLGLRPDRAAWARGTKLIEGMRDAVGRFTRRAAIALAGVGVGATVLGDKYTELENRIRQVSSSNEELNQLMDRTRAIAQATRSDWKSTGEAFVRLKNATKDMGLSTDRTLKLIETLNMALQSSGASASEAAAGTLQLMQGLASGALQGDEFRSIAEQLPDLMDLFAKDMGVSRGELKKLGAEGKITSKVVVNALEHASGSIRDKFAKSTATASQRWVQLKNSLMLASAEFIRSTGLGDALGRAVERISTWVESHRDEIHEFGAKVGEAFGIAYDVVSRIVNFLIDHSDAVAAAIVTITGAMIGFKLEAIATWAAALGPLLPFIAAIGGLVYVIIKVAKHWDEIKRAVRRALDAAWGAIKGFAKKIASPFIAAGKLVKDAFQAIVDFVTDKFNWIIDKAQAAADAVRNAANRVNPFGDHEVSPEQFQALTRLFNLNPPDGATPLPSAASIAQRIPVPSVRFAPTAPAAPGAAPGALANITQHINVTASPDMNAGQLATKVATAMDERIRTAFANVAATRGVP